MELLKVEFTKIKKSSVLSIAVCIGILSVIVILKPIQNMGAVLEAKYMIFEVLNFSAISYLTMFLPLLCIYVACNITKVENENSGWKQLMLLPLKKSTIYLNKYKVMILTLLVSISAYIISILIGSIYLTKNFYFSTDLIIYGVEIFIATLPLIILLFIIGRRFISIIPVISVGVGMIITNVFIVQSRFWIFAPWTYSMAFIGGGLSNEQKVLALIISIILSALLFSIDYFAFTNEDIKEK